MFILKVLQLQCRFAFFVFDVCVCAALQQHSHDFQTTSFRGIHQRRPITVRHFVDVCLGLQQHGGDARRSRAEHTVGVSLVFDEQVNDLQLFGFAGCIGVLIQWINGVH